MFGWLKRKKDAPAAVEAAPVVKNEQTFSITDVDQWEAFFGPTRTAAGPVVTAETAMRFSAVFSCVRLISGAISSSPIKVYLAHGEDLRRRNAGHPYEKMLRKRPNRFMTAATFWKFMAQSKLLTGNAVAHIVRTRGGVPVALIPLKPSQVSIYHAWEIGLDKKIPGVERNRLFYSVTFDDGAFKTFDQDDILHIPNVGWDGKKGMSTVRAMAQGVGLALGSEESSARFFSNGMMAQVALKYPSKMDKDELERLRMHLNEKYSGVGNHHKPLILTQGGDVQTLSISAGDAQLLESRKFSVIDICRFFGVPPVMIGETEKTSSWGSGVEQMARWFTMFTMNEHFTAFEQELDVKLFYEDAHFAEFDETELTRGDTKTRAEYNKAALGSMQQPGWLTQNEVRAAEGYGPAPGGDELQRPTENAGAPAKE